MNQIRGRIQLAKFRTNKNPKIPLCLISSLLFLLICLKMLIDDKMLLFWLASSVGFSLSMIGVYLIDNINKRYKTDLNLIRKKYGLPLEMS